MDTLITTDNIHALESMVASLTELISVQETVVSEQSELLRQNESRFRAIFNGSNDAIMLLTEEGFFDCNPSALKIFGITTKEEFVKFTPAELSPPTQTDGGSSLEAAGEHIRTAFRTGTDRFEWIHRRFNGEDFPAEVLLSENRKNTIRGLHYQHPEAQHKIVWCTKGEIFEVLLDLRKTSPSYGKWHGLLLSAKQASGVFVPQGVAHG